MTENYSSELRIPKDRVAVLIGKKGFTKRVIQKKTKTKIFVSKEGEVEISSKDPINNFISSLIIKAIGRGFNPEIALKLLDEKNTLEIIEMKQFSKGSKKRMTRIKSRLIGRKGKAWKMLEILTNTHISVHGKTASIIGEITDVMVAKQAVEKLLKGSPHGNVYMYIENQKKTKTL